MFVKSLRLTGFKSFATPTILEFDAGVNVIVGPNGSGKSNIADALAWVLGSQAPSSLRGGSMEDVIFAGSASRPRLGMAEVELTLDNAAKTLPLQVSEATITRFTDRSGASEYRINGASCRLLDIAELLSDAGIGRSFHTLVGQGQLDQVLHAQPEDRRAFIEEAAQIGKYRRRKERSLRKLERVDANLVRLEDVLGELRRALRPLKRQASAAAAYSELVAEQRELRQRIAATDLAALELERRDLDLASENRRVDLVADELDGIRERLQQAGEERERRATAAEDARDLAHRLARAADRLTGIGRVAEERGERLEARLAAETEEGYRERIRLLESDSMRWGAESARLEEEAESARRKAVAARAAAERDRDALHSSEHDVAGARRAETAAAQALVRAEGAESAGRATIEAWHARVAAVVERRASAERALRAEADAAAAAEAEVEGLEKELDAAVERAAAAEAELETHREAGERFRDRLGASSADRAAAHARLEVLHEVAALFADQPSVLDRLRDLLDDAAERARMASATVEEASTVLDRARAEEEKQWAEVSRLDDDLKRHDALLSGAADRFSSARRRYERRETELAALDEELARVRDALADAERATIEERAALPAHRATQQEARAALQEAEEATRRAGERSQASQLVANEVEVDARGAEERSLAARLRLEEATAGIADAQGALEGLADRRAELRRSGARSRAVAETARLCAGRAERWADHARTRADDARGRARAADERLLVMRRRERELEQALEAAHARRSELEILRAEQRTRAEALAERAMDEWGLSAEDLGALERLETEQQTSARARVATLDRELKRLGPVNPSAADEYAAAAERERFLVGQVEDLEASKKDLLQIVTDIDRTIVEVFGQAYEEVAHEFETVIGRLFPGGRGRLVLTDPDDVLNSGIEIEARPPGKNVRKLSLLSGGERSLVALAFLFAIFRARPSPFYLLDEVEAALDDINLQRFIGLVRELEERAQVLVVTHQKRTMEAADVLYGVSMGSDGMSQVIAKRMAVTSASPSGDAGRSV